MNSRPRRSIVNGVVLLAVLLAALGGVAMCSRSGSGEGAAEPTVTLPPDTISAPRQPEKKPRKTKKKQPQKPDERSPLDERL